MSNIQVQGRGSDGLFSTIYVVDKQIKLFVISKISLTDDCEWGNSAADVKHSVDLL